jgi:hypothetical protein
MYFRLQNSSNTSQQRFSPRLISAVCVVRSTMHAPHVYGDSPNHIRVPNGTSVTFKSWINGSGYIVTDNVLTYW